MADRLVRACALVWKRTDCPPNDVFVYAAEDIEGVEPKRRTYAALARAVRAALASPARSVRPGTVALRPAPDRFLRNLLSSEPPCFNLLDEVARGLDLAARVVSTMRPGRVERVTEIRAVRSIRVRVPCIRASLTNSPISIPLSLSLFLSRSFRRNARMHGADKNKPPRGPRAARTMHAVCTGRLLTAANHLVWLIRGCLHVWLRVTASTYAHAVAVRGDGARQPQRVRMVRVAAHSNAREREERHPDLGGAVFQGFLPPKTVRGLWSPSTE